MSSESQVIIGKDTFVLLVTCYLMLAAFNSFRGRNFSRELNRESERQEPRDKSSKRGN